MTIAIGVTRLVHRHAIIRKFSAVETMDSISVVCSNKTETLTENPMTVQEIIGGGEGYGVSGVVYNPAKRSSTAREGRLKNRRRPWGVRYGVLCNDSLLLEDEGRWYVQGNPTEGTFLTVAAKAGLSIAALSPA